jgi:hypothetical protein
MSVMMKLIKTEEWPSDDRIDNIGRNGNDGLHYKELHMDIMLDLETLGVRAGCGIIAVGACTFPDTENQFYEKILPADNITHGLQEDPNTMAWWSKQSQAAREESFSGTKKLIEVLGAFADWCRRQGTDITVWGNGADFDLPILIAAYHAVGMKQPWRPYNGRCYRTLKNLHPTFKAEDFKGEKHTALADAIHQAKHATMLLAFIKR